ncbi:MAG: hypothetical protein OEY06_01255 [Gammaproteobacteria bacterium]|nr:hypothetical protein [Gammaproteobacteria bacterium]
MTVFERYPKTTLSTLFITFLLIIDIGAAALFSSIGLYKPQYKIESYYRIENEIFHHTLAANITNAKAQWGPILGYEVNTNSLGFKDSQPRKISLEKTNHRILLMGDSFTEGVGYAYNDTFAGILDKNLKNKNIEVLNAAVSSYSPIIYYRKTQYLINKGLEFDHMVVFVDISDIEDEAKNYIINEDGNVISKRAGKLNYKLKRFITENTIILSNIRILLRKSKNSVKAVNEPKFDDVINAPRSLWTINDGIYNDYGKKGLKLAEQHMTMLANLLKTNNIKLTIVVYPWPDQIWHKDLESKQVIFWQNWSKEHNADFINLFPTFINASNPKKTIEDYFIFGDFHWNKKGHNLIAESILPQL